MLALPMLRSKTVNLSLKTFALKVCRELHLVQLNYLPVQVGDEQYIQGNAAYSLVVLLLTLKMLKFFAMANALCVCERPTISNIFDGNDDIKDEQLQEAWTTETGSIGEPLDKTVLTSIENGLKDFFYSIGKYNADVTAIITPLPRNRVDLKLLFEEGDAAEIEQINIVGNEIFSDEELMEAFELQYDTPWWDFLSETRYQQQTLQGDMETLRNHYLNRGYLRFNVDSTQVSMTPEKSGIYIAMNVTEGEQYHL